MLEFRQVDVFTDRPLAGNPLAVVLDADDLDAETMQAVAAETNLSETAFVLRPTAPDADYRVRIFTPARELPFAGHPSVGTAYILLEEGRLGALEERLTVRQEVGIGVLPIEITATDGGPSITMTQGRPQLLEKMEDVGRLAAGLGCAVADLSSSGLVPRVASTGLRQLMVPLSNIGTLESLAPDLTALAGIERDVDVTGISAFVVVAPGKVRVRFFSPTSGIVEDPATGSAAGALGAYLAFEGLLSTVGGRAQLRVSQGAEIGRPGRIDVTVEMDGGTPTVVLVGGRCVTVMRGRLSL